MQVFNTYFKILKKRISSIIIYAVLFLFITIMISSNINNENEKYQPSKVPIAVINRDGQSSLIDGFLKHLGNYVTYVKIKDNENAIKDALFLRKIVYVLIIPEGFTEDFRSDSDVKLTKQTAPDSIEAISVDNTINNYFNMAKVYQKHIPGISNNQLNADIEQSLAAQTSVDFQVKLPDEVSGSNTFNKYYFNYLGYIIVSGFITAVSIVMLSFHGLDIRRKHYASPLTNKSMSTQLIFANLIFVFVYLLLFIVAGYVLNTNRIININTILFWVNTTVFALTALSISYLVGIAVESKKAIGALSTAISLSMAFISGIFVPQDYLGASVLKLASFTPAYWFVKANNTLETLASFHWNDLSGVFGYMIIQLGFAAAILSIALVVGKRKRQQAF